MKSKKDDKPEPDDRAQFAEYFVSNQHIEGMDYFLGKARHLFPETGSLPSDAEQLAFISASVYYCRFSLITGNWKSADDYMNALLLSHRASIEEDSELHAELLHNQAELAFYNGRYTKAVEHAQKAVSKKETANFNRESDRNLSKGQSYVVCGKSFWKQGDYYEALKCYYQAIYCYRQVDQNPYNYLPARVYCLIGQLKLDLQEYDSAEKFLRESIRIYEECLPPRHFYTGAAYNELGKCLAIQATSSEIEKLNEAESLFEKSLEALHFSFPEKPHRYKASVLSNRAELERKKTNQIEAGLEGWKDIIRLYEEEWEMRKLALDEARHPTIGICYTKMARVYLENRSFVEAAEYAQKALNSLSADVDLSSLFDNPSESAIQQSESQQALLNALYLKAYTLLQLWRMDERFNQYLYLAYKAIVPATYALDMLRERFRNTGTILAWGKDARIVYETAIEIAYQIMAVPNQSGDDSLPESCRAFAFRVFPKTKAALLWAFISKSQRATPLFWNKPDLQRFENEIISVPPPPINIRRLQEVLGHMEEYSNVQAEEFEDTVRFIMEGQVVLPEQISPCSPFTLDNFFAEFSEGEDGMVVSYFLGERFMYVLLINGREKSMELKKLPYLNRENGREKLVREIDALLDTFNNDQRNLNPFGIVPEFPTGFEEETILILSRLDFLYKSLIYSLGIPPAVKRLYIIPDGQLSLLPFEMLAPMPFLPPDQAVHYGDVDFLIRRYKISYHASISILFHNHCRQKEKFNHMLKRKNTLLSISAGIASNGIYTDEANMELEEGCRAVAQALKMKAEGGRNHLVLKRQSSTKSNVKKAMSQKRVIHFFTHTEKDGINDGLLQILLQDNNGLKEYLTYKDILDVAIDAELIMLNACKGGWGTLTEGEGPLALNRAFLRSGGRNIYFSLFRITAENARILATAFAGNLAGKRMNYVSALQAAKAGMIEGRRRAHPAFWAAPAFMGNQMGGLSLPTRD